MSSEFLQGSNVISLDRSSFKDIQLERIFNLERIINWNRFSDFIQTQSCMLRKTVRRYIIEKWWLFCFSLHLLEIISSKKWGNSLTVTIFFSILLSYSCSCLFFPLLVHLGCSCSGPFFMQDASRKEKQIREIGILLKRNCYQERTKAKKHKLLKNIFSGTSLKEDPSNYCRYHSNPVKTRWISSLTTLWYTML
jgi:hypothetical protein